MRDPQQIGEMLGERTNALLDELLKSGEVEQCTVIVMVNHGENDGLHVVAQHTAGMEGLATFMRTQIGAGLTLIDSVMGAHVEADPSIPEA